MFKYWRPIRTCLWRLRSTFSGKGRRPPVVSTCWFQGVCLMASTPRCSTFNGRQGLSHSWSQLTNDSPAVEDNSLNGGVMCQNVAFSEMSEQEFKDGYPTWSAVTWVTSHDFPAAVAMAMSVSFQVPLHHTTPKQIPETPQLRAQSPAKSQTAVFFCACSFQLPWEHEGLLTPWHVSN